jgi:glucose-1-phosphate thymidylyltransferase
VGFRSAGEGGPRPKPVAHYLLEKMARAGAGKAYIVLRDGKWDIPAYFGSGHLIDMDLAYLLMRRPYGVPFTLDDAYPFIRGSDVLFGFPDILFQPEDAFGALVEAREETGADLAVAVFPSLRPEYDDVVELDPEGRIRRFEVRAGDTSLRHTWLVAAWGPAFTEFLHDFVEKVAPEVVASGGTWQGRELFMGDALWAAVESGMQVETALFEKGKYIDIGTPEDLVLALRDVAEFRR